MSLTLNGFLVHPKLELLMSRDDWPGKRTHENWLNRFPAIRNHQDARSLSSVPRNGQSEKTKEFNNIDFWACSALDDVTTSP